MLSCIYTDQIADRGERLELLVDKTEDLSANVSCFFMSLHKMIREKFSVCPFVSLSVCTSVKTLTLPVTLDLCMVLYSVLGTYSLDGGKAFL